MLQKGIQLLYRQCRVKRAARSMSSNPYQLLRARMGFIATTRTQIAANSVVHGGIFIRTLARADVIGVAMMQVPIATAILDANSRHLSQL